MGRLHGITVALTVKTQAGVDPLGAPVYEEATERIENVLVGQPTPQEIIDTLNLTGKRIAYTLGIPRGDTHEWEDTTVTFLGRTYRTVGPVSQGIGDLIPLDWDRNIQVERYDV